jgi:hypothetical protein
MCLDWNILAMIIFFFLTIPLAIALLPVFMILGFSEIKNAKRPDSEQKDY